MSTADFDFVVAEFMRDYGTTGQFIRTVTGQYDPNTGTTPTTVTEIDVEVILMDLTLQSNGYSVKYGTLVQAGDKDIYMRPPNKVVPYMMPLEINPATDSVRVNGIVYKIVTMKEVNTTGTNAIVYSLYARR